MIGSDTKVFRKDTIIFESGNDVTEIYYIVKGMVRFSSETTTGYRMVNMLEAGDFLGDTSLFTDDGQTLAYFGSALAVEDTVCDVIPIEVFRAQIKAAPKLIQLWMYNTVDRAVRTIVSSQSEETP